jgi:hypothetical protein
MYRLLHPWKALREWLEAEIRCPNTGRRFH